MFDYGANNLGFLYNVKFKGNYLTNSDYAKYIGGVIEGSNDLITWKVMITITDPLKSDGN